MSATSASTSSSSAAARPGRRPRSRPPRPAARVALVEREAAIGGALRAPRHDPEQDAARRRAARAPRCRSIPRQRDRRRHRGAEPDLAPRPGRARARALHGAPGAAQRHRAAARPRALRSPTEIELRSLDGSARTLAADADRHRDRLAPARAARRADRPREHPRQRLDPVDDLPAALADGARRRRHRERVRLDLRAPRRARDA